jgi:hypothetical protein
MSDFSIKVKMAKNTSMLFMLGDFDEFTCPVSPNN